MKKLVLAFAAVMACGVGVDAADTLAEILASKAPPNGKITGGLLSDGAAS